MPFRVFLSYSLDASEMALAWRLQTLAAAHGIQMYAPHDGNGTAASIVEAVRQAIDHADCVLAILTTVAGKMVQNELDYALENGRSSFRSLPRTLPDTPSSPGFREFSHSPHGTIPAQSKATLWNS